MRGLSAQLRASRTHRHHLSSVAAQLLAFAFHQILALCYEILGDFVAQYELLDAKVVHHLVAKLEEGGHAEETHQDRQVDKQVIRNKADSIHMTDDLSEGSLLQDGLLGDVRIQVDETEKSQAQRRRQAT